MNKIHCLKETKYQNEKRKKCSAVDLVSMTVAASCNSFSLWTNPWSHQSDLRVVDKRRRRMMVRSVENGGGAVEILLDLFDPTAVVPKPLPRVVGSDSELVNGKSNSGEWWFGGIGGWRLMGLAWFFFFFFSLVLDWLEMMPGVCSDTKTDARQPELNKTTEK